MSWLLWFLSGYPVGVPHQGWSETSPELVSLVQFSILWLCWYLSSAHHGVSSDFTYHLKEALSQLIPFPVPPHTLFAREENCLFYCKAGIDGNSTQLPASHDPLRKGVSVDISWCLLSMTHPDGPSSRLFGGHFSGLFSPVPTHCI